MKIQPGFSIVFARFLDILDTHEILALSTIIETRGSSPQVAGASAVFSRDGLIFGTVGGGGLEVDVQEASLQALKTRSSFYRTFSLDTDLTSEEGAICGGKVCVLIDGSPEKSRPAFLGLVQSLSRHQPGVLVTCIDKISGDRVSVKRTWLERRDSFSHIQEETFLGFSLELENVFKRRQPALFRRKIEAVPDEREQLVFFEPVFPLPKLVIAGAGHIGQAVAHLGHRLDFEVTVIDDRPEFANQERMPQADCIIVDDIGKTIRNFPIASDTFVVIVTRGHRHDSEALRACIVSQAAYIGMIGSRSKIKQMRQQFLKQGWATAGQFDRVYAPIGLDISSETVQEIAVSIAAQLVQVRSQIQKEQERR